MFMGLLSMALFRPFLALNKQIRFYKLLGTGTDGHFSGRADLSRWAIFCVREKNGTASLDEPAHSHLELFGGFLNRFWKWAGAHPRTWILDPYFGHGSWSGVDARAWISNDKQATGPMAVITRATVRWRRMRSFHGVASSFGRSPLDAPGCQHALGIGEWPLRLQATFSVWENESYMKNFAYSDALHQDIIRRTRQEGWYQEELFLRCRVVAFVGSD